MILPSLHGSFHQTDFFVYAAADRSYFDAYGRALINSVLRNTIYGIHIHIYDPTPEQIKFCNQPRISVTWEYTEAEQFCDAINFWSTLDLAEPWLSRKTKMLGMQQFHDYQDIEKWMRKTYYACMRFVRLAEFLDQPCRFLEIDIDGLVRSNFDTQFADDDAVDVYLYEKVKTNPATGRSHSKGHLAGSILFTPKQSCWNFIQELAADIQNVITDDRLYWFLDQNALDRVITGYRKGDLPLGYVDWHMQPDSAIWTAKGRRKELEIFQRELDIYR